MSDTATPPEFSRAKAQVLAAVAKHSETPDANVPDTIRFANDGPNFKVLMRYGRAVIEGQLAWEAIRHATMPVLQLFAKDILAQLAPREE